MRSEAAADPEVLFRADGAASEVLELVSNGSSVTSSPRSSKSSVVYMESRLDSDILQGLGTTEERLQFVTELLEAQKRGELVQPDDALALCAKAEAVLKSQPTLVDVDLPANERLHVVGDLHGQYYDLLHILETHGLPRDGKSANRYLFNGDFVDRGQYSVEVLFLLFGCLVAFPDHVFLNRGNHETAAMNAAYGFEEEVLFKYDTQILEACARAFRALPLSTLVNKAVLVMHGGLANWDGVRLEEIRQIDRFQEPDGGPAGSPEDLMMALLWSDPAEQQGRAVSPRGPGITIFGPDVTERFCRENKLQMIIRSHEVAMEGYEIQAGERCLTVFSAPNYCDVHGNLGSVADLVANPPSEEKGEPSDNSDAFTTPAIQVELTVFEAAPHPDRYGKRPKVAAAAKM